MRVFHRSRVFPLVPLVPLVPRFRDAAQKVGPGRGYNYGYNRDYGRFILIWMLSFPNGLRGGPLEK